MPTSNCVHCKAPTVYHPGSGGMGSIGLPWWTHEDGSVFCGPEYGTDKGATPEDNPTRKHAPDCLCDLQCKPREWLV